MSKKVMYVITKKRGWRPINNIWDGEFCDGAKKVIEVKNNIWVSFHTRKEAEEWIKYKLEKLEEWFNKDIPEQAKEWPEKETPQYYGRDYFLKRMEEMYKENKKAIENLVVREVDASDWL